MLQKWKDTVHVYYKEVQKLYLSGTYTSTKVKKIFVSLASNLIGVFQSFFFLSEGYNTDN